MLSASCSPPHNYQALSSSSRPCLCCRLLPLYFTPLFFFNSSFPQPHCQMSAITVSAASQFLTQPPKNGTHRLFTVDFTLRCHNIKLCRFPFCQQRRRHLGGQTQGCGSSGSSGCWVGASVDCGSRAPCRCTFRSGRFGNQTREFGGQVTLSEGMFLWQRLKDLPTYIPEHFHFNRRVGLSVSQMVKGRGLGV